MIKPYVFCLEIKIGLSVVSSEVFTDMAFYMENFFFNCARCWLNTDFFFPEWLFNF